MTLSTIIYVPLHYLCAFQNNICISCQLLSNCINRIDPPIFLIYLVVVFKDY